MYQSFYGLSEAPFELLYDPRFVFYTPGHREAHNHVEAGLISASSITVLIGPPGIGKSTVLQQALQSERCNHIECVYLKNPTLLRGTLVETLLGEFKAGPPPPGTTPLQALHSALCDRGSRGIFSAVALDEAENLVDETLDELCQLTTLQAANIQLLPIVLAGQPSLIPLLEQPRMRALKADDSRRWELRPLDLPQTASFILWRARTAGAFGGRLFTREAVAVIHHFSKGIPRLISVICDNALLAGCRGNHQPVTHEIVREVCEQLDLAAPRAAAATTTAPLAATLQPAATNAAPVDPRTAFD